VSRLLERQTELVEYLTSGAAIFGGRAGRTRKPDGFDTRLLRLEARFSHEKRLGKIRAVLPRTFESLGTRRDALVRKFAMNCPQSGIGRLDNAREFHAFLAARSEGELETPPHSADVAAVELACAEANNWGDTIADRVVATRGVALAPSVILLRCAYDIRPIFDDDSGDAPPAKRDTPLAIFVPPGTTHPQVVELPATVFELVSALAAITDRAAFEPPPELEPLIAELVEAGLVERGRCE
jgi:hypothetical protein